MLSSFRKVRDNAEHTLCGFLSVRTTSSKAPHSLCAPFAEDTFLQFFGQLFEVKVMYFSLLCTGIIFIIGLSRKFLANCTVREVVSQPKNSLFFLQTEILGTLFAQVCWWNQSMQNLLHNIKISTGSNVLDRTICSSIERRRPATLWLITQVV